MAPISGETKLPILQEVQYSTRPSVSDHIPHVVSLSVLYCTVPYCIMRRLMLMFVCSETTCYAVVYICWVRAQVANDQTNSSLHLAQEILHCHGFKVLFLFEMLHVDEHDARSTRPISSSDCGRLFLIPTQGGGAAIILWWVGS